MRAVSIDGWGCRKRQRGEEETSAAIVKVESKASAAAAPAATAPAATAPSGKAAEWEVNDDGAAYLSLSDLRRVTVGKRHGSGFVDVREFYGTPQKPGKKGLCMSLSQYEALKAAASAIDEALERAKGDARPSTRRTDGGRGDAPASAPLASAGVAPAPQGSPLPHRRAEDARGGASTSQQGQGGSIGGSPSLGSAAEGSAMEQLQAELEKERQMRTKAEARFQLLEEHYAALKSEKAEGDRARGLLEGRMAFMKERIAELEGKLAAGAFSSD